MPAAATPTTGAIAHGDVDALIAASDIAVRGRVGQQQSFWNSDRSAIFTDSVIDIHYAIVGPTSPAIVVRTLGGELAAEDIGMTAIHTASLHPGQEVLLFLKSHNDHYTVTDGAFGLFRIQAQGAHNQGAATALSLPDLYSHVKTTAQSTRVTLPADWRATEGSLGTSNPTDYIHTGHRWPGESPAVEFYANTTSGQHGAQDGSESDFLDEIMRAANTWTGVNTAAFSLQFGGQSNQRTVERNGVNEVMFIEPVNASSLLAQSRYWYFVGSGEIFEADIWFNDLVDFDATGNPDVDETDLQSVALHEFGHWLALGHDADQPAVMYASLTRGSLKRHLHENDIEGISAIYPCPSNDCGAAPIPSVTPPATATPTAPPTFTPTATNTPQPPMRSLSTSVNWASLHSSPKMDK